MIIFHEMMPIKSKFTNMLKYNQNSRSATVFHAFSPLEEGETLAGYAALISDYRISVPAPDYLCAIGTRHKRYEKGRWRIFTPRHKPDNSLNGHLTFALKNEGLDLAVLKALFVSIEPEAITYYSAYGRRFCR